MSHPRPLRIVIVAPEAPDRDLSDAQTESELERSRGLRHRPAGERLQHRRHVAGRPFPAGAAGAGIAENKGSWISRAFKKVGLG